MSGFNTGKFHALVSTSLIPFAPRFLGFDFFLRKASKCIVKNAKNEKEKKKTKKTLPFALGDFFEFFGLSNP